MADTKISRQIELANKEIGEILCDLSSYASPIGDWKIIKIQEARLMGQEDPYDLEDLVAKRQAARDRINDLQANVATLTLALEEEERAVEA